MSDDMSKEKPTFTLSCPAPIRDYGNVLLAHGGGGRLMHDLIEKVFAPAFTNPYLGQRHDGAVVEVGGARLAFTTDGHAVSPLFFPGGDIGSLSVNGTVNDLAMCGARPLYLSAAFLIEEGFPVADLTRVVDSMGRAAKEADVLVVTGDTKVVDKGKGDGVFVTTAGVGLVEHDLVIAPSSVTPGDVLILSGDVGRHGMAVMSVREGLAFESEIVSDCAPLHDLVLAWLEAGVKLRCLRDLTRGGLAGAVVEIAQDGKVEVEMDERAVPVREDVRGACEILGLDPLYVANEGRLVAFVAPEDEGKALDVLGRLRPGLGGGRIGRVTGRSAHGNTVLKTAVGASRLLTLLSGEQLPRIC